MLGANTAIAKTTIKYLHKYTIYHPVSLAEYLNQP